MTNTRALPTEMMLLDSFIRESGLTPEALAEKAGITLKTAAMVLRGWASTPRMRRRFELALDCPIWTPAAEFERQQKLVEWLGGFDPFLRSVGAAQAFAKRKRIPIGIKNPSRVVVIERLMAAYDAAHRAKPARRGAAKKISTVGTPQAEKAPNPK